MGNKWPGLSGRWQMAEKYKFQKCPICGEETAGFMVLKPFPDRHLFQDACDKCSLRFTGSFTADKPTFVDGQNNWAYATHCLLGHKLPESEWNRFWHRCPTCIENVPRFVKSVQDWILNGKKTKVVDSERV